MITASIVGATGFTGAVLTDILAGHPHVRLGKLTSSSYVGRSVDDVFPDLRVKGRYETYSAGLCADSDVVFVCYPHGQACAVVEELLQQHCRVVDLSADFRLNDPALYETWYGFEHPRPDLLQEAVFGLPETNREQIKDARLVANPGCYPTSMLLGILPLSGWIDPRGVVVDAKSGVSGAGRNPSERTHFCRVHDDFAAYSEVGHRHTPEMVQELSRAVGGPVAVSFTPHLLPVDRGILSTIYSWPLPGFDPGSLAHLFHSRYVDEPFVEVVEKAPTLRDVQRTNYCRIYPAADDRAGVVKVISVIDNLVKGASGQAVQNMNIMFGLEETAGLLRRV